MRRSTPTWHLAPGWAVVTALLSVISTLSTIAVPLLVGQVLDRITTSGDVGPDFVRLTGALLVAAGCGVGSSLANGVYTARVTQTLRAQAITRATDRHARDLPSSGDLATRLLVDAAQPAAGLGIVISIGLAAATLFVALGSIALIDWWVLVGLVVGLVGVIAVVRRFVADSTPALETYRVNQARIADRALDAQRGAASIQAHGTWLTESERVLAPLSELRAAGRSLWSLQGRMAWRAGIFVPAALLVTVAVGSVSLAQDRISVGELATLVGYAGLVIGSLDGIEAAAGLAPVRVGRRRLAEVLAGGPAAEDKARSAASVGGSPVSLRLEAARVSSRTDEPTESTLVGTVDLHVPAGRSLTVSGHPALLAAVARLASGAETPTSGQVLVDGLPLRDLAPDAHVTALAGARPALLGETVRGLLTLGLPRVDDAQLRRAAAMARIDHVVESLPGGYDTPLAELALSGGELQRLGIAQALLHGSGLVVLDEATSSLDPATELEIVHALLDAHGTRTLLIASSRPALAAAADHTIVLETPTLPTELPPTARPVDSTPALVLSGEQR